MLRRDTRQCLAFASGLLAILTNVACGDDESASPGPTSSSSGAGGSGGSGPPPKCDAPTAWTPGTPAFQEATAKWKLDAIAAEGVRLSAVDFDGDGWTDLVVRRGASVPDDFAPGGKRNTWLLRNTGTGTFEDVTQASGIVRPRTTMDANVGRPGTVYAFGDVDNDGDLDVYTGFDNDPMMPVADTSEVMLNAGDGTFELGPETSELRIAAPKIDSVAGATFVDVDRDGRLDLWTPQGSVSSQPRQSLLYLGDGAGSFVDITTAAGLKTKAWGSDFEALNTAQCHPNSWSGAACDLDGDGNAELLASSYGRAPNHLWKGGGPGVPFSNVSIASGYAFDERADWSDNESARCWCMLHPTDEDCAGIPPPMYIVCDSDDDAFRWNHAIDREPFRLGGNSGATECADIDNDGDLDLLTGEIVHWDVGSSSDPAELLINTGETPPRFERPGNDVTGLAREHQGVDWNEGIMTGSVFDFDNDGRLDVYLGASDYPGNWGLLSHQTTTAAVFEPVPVDVGIDHKRSHGSAVADFDRDGDLDIVVGHSHARCDDECYPTQQVRFFENVMGKGGSFVQLSLRGGQGSNRSAIGARVTAKTGDVTQTREVGGGHGHYGAQDDLVVHFGLGDACEAEITIRWPDAALSTQTFTVPAGYRFTVEQGSDPVVVP